jgi:predicted nicotinamide N-methyase
MENKPLNMQQKILEYTGIIINESIEYDDIEKVGVGGRIWKSSVVLSAILKSEKLRNFINFNNKKVLEIGAGAGICGIVCATLNIDKITITDRDPGCLMLIEKNIAENSEKLNKDKIQIKSFDWGSKEQLEKFKGTFDILIGSDIFYSAFMIEPLCNALDFLCEADNEMLISLADRGGEDSDCNKFLQTINALRKFEIEILPDDLLKENFGKIITLKLRKNKILLID